MRCCAAGVLLLQILILKSIPQYDQKGHQSFLPRSWFSWLFVCGLLFFFLQFRENENHKRRENRFEVDTLTDSNRAGMLLVLTSPEQVIRVWHALSNKLQLQEN